VHLSYNHFVPLDECVVLCLSLWVQSVSPIEHAELCQSQLLRGPGFRPLDYHAITPERINRFFVLEGCTCWAFVICIMHAFTCVLKIIAEMEITPLSPQLAIVSTRCASPWRRRRSCTNGRDWISRIPPYTIQREAVRWQGKRHGEIHPNDVSAMHHPIGAGLIQ
jgi:hypothetical protein